MQNVRIERGKTSATNSAMNFNPFSTLQNEQQGDVS